MMGKEDLTSGQKWALLWAFACLQIVGAAIHEPWFDELHAWNIVTASQSLRELVQNLNYENHPWLWYILLYPISRIWNDPLAMQLFHAAIAVSSLGVFLRYAPFRGFEKVLFALGHFTLYDYGVVSRNYSLFTLFLWAYIALTVHKPDRLLTRALLLGMAGMSHILAAVLVLLLAIDAAIDELKAPLATDSRSSGLGKRIAAGAIVFGLSIVGFLQATPPKDASYLPGENLGDGVWRLSKALSAISDALLPIPILGEPGSWYGTWFAQIADVFGQIYLPVALLVGGALVFSHLLRRRLAFIVFALFIVVISYLTLLIYPRHCGIIFMLGIAFLWLEGGFHSSSKRKRQVWVALLLVQALGGTASYFQDIRFPFSPAKATGAYLRQFETDNYLISALVDFPVMALPAYLKNSVYSYQKRDFQRFVVFNHKDGSSVARLPLPELSMELKRKYRGEILLTNSRLSQADFEKRIEQPELMRVFDGGLVANRAGQTLYVYRFLHRKDALY